MTAHELIKSHEGLRLRRYKCPAGHWSIGYGWNLDEWPLPPHVAAYFHVNGRITEGMADYLLDIQIGTAMHDCRDLYPGFDGFSERRRAALTDFLYNVGSTRALGFRKMRKAIIAGDWNEAAEQVRDSAYWRQLGGDPIGTDDGRTERPERIAAMLREG
jgi:lysozyme